MKDNKREVVAFFGGAEEMVKDLKEKVFRYMRPQNSMVEALGVNEPPRPSILGQESLAPVSIVETDPSTFSPLQGMFPITLLKRRIAALAIRVVFVTSVFLHANTAIAIVTEPQPLTPADQKAFRDVSSLIDRSEIPSIDRLFVRWVGIEDDLFLVAQIRNDKCISDKCLTCIISYAGETKRIVLAAYLAAKMTVSDVVKDVCFRCDRIYTLIFEDSSGARYYFGVTNAYAVMFDRSLRDYRK